MPCKRWAIKGGRVCPAHGGSAGQVKRSARERLQALVEPAISGLRKAMEKGDYRDVVKAAQIVLDRVGCGPSQHVSVEAELRVVPIRPASIEEAKRMLLEVEQRVDAEMLAEAKQLETLPAAERLIVEELLVESARSYLRSRCGDGAY
ncbi:MAG TPA: hypothetical protein VNB06_05525 [Thermoanaerobaculia bacterium]|nr:hypothetical protein [Thermoanaerobaculia bacterium]